MGVVHHVDRNSDRVVDRDDTQRRQCPRGPTSPPGNPCRGKPASQKRTITQKMSAIAAMRATRQAAELLRWRWRGSQMRSGIGRSKDGARRAMGRDEALVIMCAFLVQLLSGDQMAGCPEDDQGERHRALILPRNPRVTFSLR